MESGFGSKLSAGLRDKKLHHQQQLITEVKEPNLSSNISKTEIDSNVLDPISFSPTVPLQSGTGILPPHDVYRPRSLYDTHSHLPATGKLTSSHSAADVTSQPFQRHVPPRHSGSLPDSLLVSKVCKPHYGQIFNPVGPGESVNPKFQHGIKSTVQPQQNTWSKDSSLNIEQKEAVINEPLSLTLRNVSHDMYTNALKQLLEPLCAKEKQELPVERLYSGSRKFLGRTETVDVSVLNRKHEVENLSTQLSRNRPQSTRVDRRVVPPDDAKIAVAASTETIATNIAHFAPTMEKKVKEAVAQSKVTDAKNEDNKTVQKIVDDKVSSETIKSQIEKKFKSQPKPFQKAASFDEADSRINVAKWNESKEEKPIRTFTAKVPTASSVILSTEPVYPSDLTDKKNVSKTSVIFSKKASADDIRSRRSSDERTILVGHKEGNKFVRQLSMEKSEGADILSNEPAVVIGKKLTDNFCINSEEELVGNGTGKNTKQRIEGKINDQDNKEKQPAIKSSGSIERKRSLEDLISHSMMTTVVKSIPLSLSSTSVDLPELEECSVISTTNSKLNISSNSKPNISSNTPVVLKAINLNSRAQQLNSNNNSTPFVHQTVASLNFRPVTETVKSFANSEVSVNSNVLVNSPVEVKCSNDKPVSANILVQSISSEAKSLCSSDSVNLAAKISMKNDTAEKQADDKSSIVNTDLTVSAPNSSNNQLKSSHLNEIIDAIDIVVVENMENVALVTAQLTVINSP